MKRPSVLVRTFTENLMTYALGRRLGYEDMPALRGIVRQADADGQKLSAFVLGIVKSPGVQDESGGSSNRDCGKTIESATRG